MIEATESFSAEAASSADKEFPSDSVWNGRLLANSGNEQTRLANDLEEIRRQMAARGPEQLERLDNCLITFIAFDPHPGGSLTTRIADLKKFMLAGQIDPQIVDILKV